MFPKIGTTANPWDHPDVHKNIRTRVLRSAEHVEKQGNIPLQRGSIMLETVKSEIQSDMEIN